MNPEDELREQLHTQLAELQRTVEKYRDAETQERYERFEQPLDLFETSWHEQLNIEEKAELRGAAVASREGVIQSEIDKMMDRNERDREALPYLDRDGQRALWEAENRSELNIRMTPEMEKQAENIYEASRVSIQDRYSELRFDLERGVQQIHEGRELSLSETLTEKTVEAPDIEEAQYSLSAYRKLAEANPEAAKALTIQPDRSQEQEYQR